MDVQHKNIPNPDERNGLSRRDALCIAAKAGSAAVALSALSTLGGCNSAAQSRNKSKGGMIGEPIPSDPIAHSTTPTVHTPPPYKPTISSDLPLSTIPSFVIPRTKWTSAKPKRWLADPMKKVYRITVHHDAIMPVPSGSYTDSLRRMQLIRTGHLNRGWADIGYHFAIDPNGRIWQARPLELQGAHVKNNNPGNLGIVVFGNYEKIRPTYATLDSVNKMVAYAMERFNVPLSKVYTHQELRSTACPGRNLQKQMVATRAQGGKLAMAAGQRSSHS
jgi:N-acetylmuramoyl-L-alanine amidase